MAYKKNSYSIYRQYRKNRRRYNFEISIIPLLIVIYVILNHIEFILSIILGIVIIACILLVMKNRQISYTEKNVVNGKEKVKECKGDKEYRVMKSTDAGYVNKNNQKNIGKTTQCGTDYNQYFYAMECLNCGHVYKANGSDIWLRKCPKCQGGKA